MADPTMDRDVAAVGCGCSGVLFVVLVIWAVGVWSAVGLRALGVL